MPGYPQIDVVVRKAGFKMFRRQNIPNFITGGRIFLFLFVLLGMWFTYMTHEAAHLVLCVLGGIIYALDWLDGYVARKFEWQSEFGKIFDPAGDKICAYSMLAYLHMLDEFPIWALAIILFRDIVLSTIRLASLKHGFEFTTSQMGKLRTNIIGFGGGIIYLLHYWGDCFVSVEFRLGLTHAAILLLMLFAVANLVEFPGKYMLRIFPRFADKVGAVITFVIAAVYPPYTIVYAMVWITGFTLLDYGKAFKHEVDKARAENRADIKRFLYSFTWYLVMGLVLTWGVIGLLKVSTVLSIIAGNAVFAILLIRNFNLIQFKARLAKMRQNRKARQTLKQRQRHQRQ